MPNPFNASWSTQATLGLAIVIPAWIAIGFFAKNFQVPAHIFIFWYFIGMLIGIPVFLLSAKFATPSDFQFGAPQFAIVLTGILFGAVANTLVFMAVNKAPNPGLPIAIAGSASVFVFFLTIVLAALFPKYFNPSTADPYHFLGLLLTLAGVVLIGYKR